MKFIAIKSTSTKLAALLLTPALSQTLFAGQMRNKIFLKAFGLKTTQKPNQEQVTKHTPRSKPLAKYSGSTIIQAVPKLLKPVEPEIINTTPTQTFVINGVFHKAQRVAADGDCGFTSFALAYNHLIRNHSENPSNPIQQQDVREKLFTLACEEKKDLFKGLKRSMQENYIQDCIDEERDSGLYEANKKFKPNSEQEFDRYLSQLKKPGGWLGSTLGNYELQLLANAFCVEIAVLFSTKSEQSESDSDFQVYVPEQAENGSTPRVVMFLGDLHFSPLIPFEALLEATTSSNDINALD